MSRLLRASRWLSLLVGWMLVAGACAPATTPPTVVPEPTAIPAPENPNIASPSNGGTTTGGGAYTNGASVALNALPSANFSFVNWSEAGQVVWSSPAYSFSALTNRALVANIAPQLAISVGPGSNVVVSWPTPSPDEFRLLKNTRCSSTGWTEVTNLVETLNGRNQVILPVEGESYFRLFRP